MDRSSLSLGPSSGVGGQNGAGTTSSNGGSNSTSNAGPSTSSAASSSQNPSMRYRASVDAARSLYGNSSAAGLGAAGSRDSLQPSSAAGSPNLSGGLPRGSKRPSSDLLASNYGVNALSAENDAIDKWFEDLHHYEATLEEMAAASLDQSFKEELGAIEQWFRVLSEAERTAALYSLLQSSSQVQIRFFITVLQQMSRSDPMNALLSPANPQQASMEAQMEAKLASLGLKSPASPAVRQLARQSLGAMPSDPSAFLSPNSAMLHHSSSPRLNSDDAASNTTTGGSTDPANLLAQQRAKLNANAANRISAPGSLLNAYDATASLRSPLWSQVNSEQVAERPTSVGGLSVGTNRSPSPDSRMNRSRPSSMISDNGGSTNTSAEAGATSSNNNNNRNFNLLADAQLSPMLSGINWANMMTTPLVSTFGAQATGNPDTSSFGNQQSSSKEWATQNAQQQNSSQIVLDDAKKFRRNARGSDVGLEGAAGNANNASGVQGILSGMYDGSRRTSGGNPANQQQTAQALNNPNQAAAVAAQQNWRNVNGLLGQQNSPLPNSANQYATANNQGNNGLPNTANIGSPDLSSQLATMQAAIAGMNVNNPQLAMANLLAAQQQIQQQMQLQQNLNLMNMAGISPMGMMNNLQSQQMLSPVLGGMGMNMFNAPMTANSQRSDRRSPRPSDRGVSPGPMSQQNSKTAAPVVPGSGTNPDEPIDLNLLSDVPAWLRSLRLHKYTPNFEGSTWKEMVVMDDVALEGKGVAALGARRKLLKVFENVRNAQGIPHPPGARAPSAEPGNTSDLGNTSME